MFDRPNEQIPTSILLGLNESQLVFVPEHECLFHKQAVNSLQELTLAAHEAGFVLKIASSYRSFERQLTIWNNKAVGTRPVLDADGQALDMAYLNEREKVFAILRWSALPGASRHHWGTDFDVYDMSRISEDYRLQLTLEETQDGGPFAEFHHWLDGELSNHSLGFFRPYQEGAGGIAPEPWHLSYGPVSSLYAAQLSEDIVRAQLQLTDIALKETLLENLSEIYQRFVEPYR